MYRIDQEFLVGTVQRFNPHGEVDGVVVTYELNRGMGAARTEAGVLASIRALPTLPRSNHGAKTVLS
jgi:hypothetical protein